MTTNKLTIIHTKGKGEIVHKLSSLKGTLNSKREANLYGKTLS
jgi:hypothetical protein